MQQTFLASVGQTATNNRGWSKSCTHTWVMHSTNGWYCATARITADMVCYVECDRSSKRREIQRDRSHKE
ncbi:hypothetical protein H6G81_34060 [Scytonema hofmannii FACHB-248]|uniref:Uncharacterized protein n=1 Tax=Scytonema hofmannii FACHB-248 TaxID=1842502 RepID=A0ABR8H2C6_9CYAN|nr:MULTISPECIES: hypothetical protein [Nostocales]MBD2609385.1 hypothetical protein [Scytonema hofmannii FACHB-248]